MLFRLKFYLAANGSSGWHFYRRSAKTSYGEYAKIARQRLIWSLRAKTARSESKAM